MRQSPWAVEVTHFGLPHAALSSIALAVAAIRHNVRSRYYKLEGTALTQNLILRQEICNETMHPCWMRVFGCHHKSAANLMTRGSVRLVCRCWLTTRFVSTLFLMIRDTFCQRTGVSMTNHLHLYHTWPRTRSRWHFTVIPTVFQSRSSVLIISLNDTNALQEVALRQHDESG